MSKYRKNWYFVLIFFSVVGLCFYIWELETYTYLCETEANAPACFVLANKYLENEDHQNSQKFLNISCEKKYNLACEKLNENK